MNSTRKLTTKPMELKDYKAFTSMLIFPIKASAAKYIVEWFKKNVSRPGFNIDKLFLSRTSGNTELDGVVSFIAGTKLVLSGHRKNIKKEGIGKGSKLGSMQFLPYFAATAKTEIEKQLFLDILDVIPEKDLQECKDTLITQLTLMHFVVINNNYAKDFIVKCHQKNIPLNTFSSLDARHPWEFAIIRSNLKAVRALQECGIDMANSRSKSGFLASDFAFILNEYEIFKLYDKPDYDYSGIYFCLVVMNQLSEMKKIEVQDKKVDFNYLAIWERQQLTPLMLAAGNRKIKSEIKTYLLDKKEVNIDIVNYQKKSALTFFIESGDLTYVKMLLSKDAKIRLIDLKAALNYSKINVRMEMLSLLISRLIETNSDEILNSHDELGNTLLHNIFLQEQDYTKYIAIITTSPVMNLNQKQNKDPFLSPLEFVASKNNIHAFKILLEMKEVEKNYITLMDTAIECKATKILKKLIDDKLINNSLLFAKLTAVPNLKNNKKLSMLQYALPTFANDFLSENLATSLQIAIQEKSWLAVMILGSRLGVSTISKQECINIRLLLEKLSTKELNNIRKISHDLDQIYPKDLPVVPPPKLFDVKPDKKATEDKWHELQLRNLTDVEKSFKHYVDTLKLQMQQVNQYPETDDLVATTDAKMQVIIQNFQRLSLEDNIEDRINQILEFSIKINNYQKSFQSKSNDILRNSNITRHIEEKLNSIGKDKPAIPDKKNKQPAKINLPPALKLPPLTKAKQKPKKTKSVPMTPEKSKAIEIKNANVNLVITHFQSFIHKLALKKPWDEKNIIAAIQKECPSLQDIMAVKYFLESLLIELALNQPIGLGKHTEDEFRTNTLYKSFNEFNLRMGQWQEPVKMQDQQNLMEEIIKLFLAIDEYEEHFNLSGGKLKNFSPTSQLLVQLSEPSKDVRDYFTYDFFAEGVRIAHREYTRNYTNLISSDLVTKLKLLNDEQKSFTQTYFQLRSISEAQKTGDLVAPTDRALANKWRHPSDKSRQDIMNEIGKPPLNCNLDLH